MRECFAGDRISGGCNWPGVENHPVPRYPNSGCGAISLAIHRGASRVILIGYDCQKTGGQSHHHGDHPKGLGNAGSMPRWLPMFRELDKRLGSRATIINASRVSALDMFPRMTLEQAIAEDAADQRSRPDTGMD